MNEKKKHRENIFFELFKELWLNFPENSRIIHTDSPDFIIERPNGENNIGVEITELINPKNSMSKHHVTEKFTIENKVIEIAQNTFKKLKNISLQVSIHFQPNFNLKKHEVHNLGNEICQIILDETNHFDLNKINHFVREHPIPSQLVEIRGSYFPEIKHCLWYAPQGAFLPNIDNNKIIDLVKKKEKLIPKYKKRVSEISLLIVEGNPPISWFWKFENWDYENFTSTFDKVFLLRRTEKKLYELQKKQPK